MNKKNKASRVLRGGSWSYNVFYCRSASRHGDNPGFRSFNVFRMILEVK